MEKKKLIILGAGGHARTVLECIDRSQFEVIGFVDKDSAREGEMVSGFPVLGDDSLPEKWLSKGIDCCIIGIGHLGNAGIRNRLYHKYEAAGFEMIIAVHAAAHVSQNAYVGLGTVVMPGAIINTGAVINNNCIINTGTIIEHDVKISQGVHIAPGCVIAGASSVGVNAFVGAGSTVINGIQIGENSIIGAGSVVISDIPENSLALGTPAKVIREVS